VLDAWVGDRGNGPAIYQAGSSGPEEAAALLARDGRSWRTIDGNDGKPPE
jgi:glucose-6-phosphate 1-dehydrogenase